MTWLAPLYLAGALAVAAPILFHLWRRTPQGRRAFSTLMFLTPSPPRMTRLSRIEHWALLCLRGLALLLLALAFARPVWRIPATIPIAPEESELVAIVVDTSASLQRVWAGLRPVTPTGEPIVARTAVRNVIVATGHHRKGILLAPLAASQVADLISGA